MRKTAREMGVDHTTLWRWVKWHKEGGEENLARKKPYRRPWNRSSPDTENKIALLKEQCPSMTLKNAQLTLRRDNIKISINGIWSIWKRYALTGRSSNTPYTPFGPLTPEAKKALAEAKQLLGKGEVKKAAHIVNRLPSFPNDPLIEEIPENLLSPRRRLERLFFDFARIPFSEYYRKAHRIRECLEKQNLIYTSIFAALGEFLALSWLKDPAKERELIELLKTRVKGLREPSLKFLVLMHEGIMHGEYLEGEKAKECIRKCVGMLRYLNHPFFFDYAGTLYTGVSDYRNASRYWRKALALVRDEGYRRVLLWKLAFTSAVAGNYKVSIRFLKNAERRSEGSRSSFEIVRAYCAFGIGDIAQTSHHLKKALEVSESSQLRNHLATAALGLAGIQAALGNEKKAHVLIRKYTPLFKKFKMYRDIEIRDLLLGKDGSGRPVRKFPTLYLLYLLQNADSGKAYWRVLKYAQENEIIGFFHRIVLFFPRIVTELLREGKPTGLPRTILNFPVLKREIPVYDLQFLGHLRVYRNHKYLATSLRPKDSALLIYLASSREKEIPLEQIYRNFWPTSKHPPRNLAHLLVRLRKALRLPSHYLFVKEQHLIHHCYFTTDLDAYNEHLAQAKALLRAGEWGFAKREYLQAFSLFRGEPFRKMYDDWSDDKRLEALFGYETEVLAFVKELVKRQRKEEAKSLLKKAQRILPYSDEVNELFKQIIHR